MNCAVEILFAALVAVDAVLSYGIIRDGRGHEVAFARRYIGNVPLTIVLTILGAAIIILLAEIGKFYIPLYAATAAFAWVVWHNWRIWRG